MAIVATPDAVEALYRAFADRRRPRDLAASPVKDPAVAANLLAVPLRNIDADTILRYSGSAMTTIGTEDDFAYFLPRILEVAVDGPSAGLAEPFIIAGKLDLARWRDWSEAERAAVRDAFRSAFVRLRTVDPDDGDAFPWLEAMMRVDIDPRPALEAWLTDPGSAPLLQLSGCLLTLACRLENGDTEDYRSEILRDLADWFSASDVERAIVDRIDEIPPDRAHLLEQAVEAIPVLASSPLVDGDPRS
jgi:hypothetical protein